MRNGRVIQYKSRRSARALPTRDRQHYLLIFFFSDTATAEIYTLSLHDALPICELELKTFGVLADWHPFKGAFRVTAGRSEEHTSELQSRRDLVCRLLLEKKKTVTDVYRTNLSDDRTR